MKVTVSLPDNLFREAEAYARQTKKTRSQLYREALTEYLARYSPDPITEAMNCVVEQLPEPVDPFALEAARRTLERVDW